MENEDFFGESGGMKDILSLKDKAMNPQGIPNKNESKPWYLLNVSMQENLRKIQELDESEKMS